MLLWWIYCLLSLFSVIYSYPTGAPVDDSPLLCNTMTPGHGLSSQSTPSPYSISLSSEFYGQQSDTLTVTIDKVQQTDPGLKGILLQARRAVTQEIIGSWSVSDSSNFKTVSCGGGQNTAVTHTNADVKVLPGTFIWTPPSDRGSDIYIIATFVQSFLSYWVNITSPIIRDHCNGLTAGTDVQLCSGKGYCSSLENGGIRCNCEPGYSGTNCDVYVGNACSNNECSNGATCIPDTDAPEYTCLCPEGYVGTLCNTAEEDQVSLENQMTTTAASMAPERPQITAEDQVPLEDQMTTTAASMAPERPQITRTKITQMTMTTGDGLRASYDPVLTYVASALAFIINKWMIDRYC